MPAKTIFFALVCLAPMPLAAEDGAPAPADRHAAPRGPEISGDRRRIPRRLPADAADAPGDKRLRTSSSGEVERASFAGETRTPDKLSRALPPRGDRNANAKAPEARGRGLNAASSLVTGMASLAVVLGLFFAVAWAMRRSLPPGPAALPSEAVEVLGRTPLVGRQHAHLVRCGNKVLLVYVSQGVAETLTEITDPLEVDRLTGLCRQSQPQSAANTFRQLLQQFGREKASPGFLDRAGEASGRGSRPPGSVGVDAVMEDDDV